MKEAFFALSKSKLLEFFFHYEKSYGSGARAYAEKAVQRWREGDTRMSAQTTERLLKVLPPLLGTSVKYDLLRKLRERYRQPEAIDLSVNTLNLRTVVTPHVERLISRSYSLNLPADLTTRLNWLSDQDAKAASSLMAGAEASAMRHAVAQLSAEFDQIEALLSASAGATVSHRIELPYGIITIRVTRGTKMDENRSEMLPSRAGDLSTITTSDQLLKNAMGSLSPEQKSEIYKKATEEALALQVEAARADQRHLNSKRDLDGLIDEVRRADQTQADYNLSGTYNTASGTTSVRLTKNSSKTWIYVVIALAVLVLLLIVRR